MVGVLNETLQNLLLKRFMEGILFCEKNHKLAGRLVDATVFLH